MRNGKGSVLVEPKRKRTRVAPVLGRPVGDHVARRRELLIAACKVISREGYAGLSIRKIAAAAGCSTGTVTYYFSSKRAVVVALTEDMFDAVAASSLRAAASTDIYEGLAQKLRSFMNPESSVAVWLHLIVRAGHDSRIGAVIRRRYKELRDAMADALIRGQAKGQIRKDVDADLLADAICAMMDGWAINAPIDPERFTGGRNDRLVNLVATMIRA